MYSREKTLTNQIIVNLIDNTCKRMINETEYIGNESRLYL